MYIFFLHNSVVLSAATTITTHYLMKALEKNNWNEKCQKIMVYERESKILQDIFLRERVEEFLKELCKKLYCVWVSTVVLKLKLFAMKYNI